MGCHLDKDSDVLLGSEAFSRERNGWIRREIDGKSLPVLEDM